MISFNNIYVIFYYKYKHNHVVIITIYNIKNFHVRKSIQKHPKSSPGKNGYMIYKKQKQAHRHNFSLIFHANRYHMIHHIIRQKESNSKLFQAFCI